MIRAPIESCFRTYLWSVVFLVILAFPRCAVANGADLPPEIVMQGFAKPEDGQLRLLVRVPLVLLSNFVLPKRGPGYLDLARIDAALNQAAVATGQQIELHEEDVSLVPTVRQARVSLLSDRSFQSYAAALAHLDGPRLPVDTDLFWNQGFFDVELDYPIRSPESHFSIRVIVSPELGRRVKLRFEFLPLVGSARIFELPGASGWIPLDPRWYQAAWLLLKAGFADAFGIDRFVFLLCLVAPFRELRSLVAVVMVMAALQASTLTAAAHGVAGENHWLPPLFDTSLAAAIVLLAIGNLAAPSLRRRWFISAIIGGLGGFGLGHLLADQLQFAGNHSFVAVASFNVGVALGELLSLVFATVALRSLFDLVFGPLLGVIVVSAVLGHTAWHWMNDASHELAHELGHTAEAGLLRTSIVTVALWLLPALLVGGTAFFLPRRFGGVTVPTVLAALRDRE